MKLFRHYTAADLIKNAVEECGATEEEIKVSAAIDLSVMVITCHAQKII
jgi:hypothetical protein